MHNFEGRPTRLFQACENFPIYLFPCVEQFESSNFQAIYGAPGMTPQAEQQGDSAQSAEGSSRTACATAVCSHHKTCARVLPQHSRLAAPGTTAAKSHSRCCVVSISILSKSAMHGENSLEDWGKAHKAKIYKNHNFIYNSPIHAPEHIIMSRRERMGSGNAFVVLAKRLFDQNNISL